MTDTTGTGLDPDRHDTSGFDSGVASLDDWLRNTAPVAKAAGSAATWVLCRGDRVVGYYALAMGSVERRNAPSRLGRGQPDPVPILRDHWCARYAIGRVNAGGKLLCLHRIDSLPDTSGARDRASAGTLPA